MHSYAARLILLWARVSGHHPARRPERSDGILRFSLRNSKFDTVVTGVYFGGQAFLPPNANGFVRSMMTRALPLKGVTQRRLNK